MFLSLRKNNGRSSLPHSWKVRFTSIFYDASSNAWSTALIDPVSCGAGALQPQTCSCNKNPCSESKSVPNLQALASWGLSVASNAAPAGTQAFDWVSCAVYLLWHRSNPGAASPGRVCAPPLLGIFCFLCLAFLLLKGDHGACKPLFNGSKGSIVVYDRMEWWSWSDWTTHSTLVTWWVVGLCIFLLCSTSLGVPDPSIDSPSKILLRRRIWK